MKKDNKFSSKLSVVKTNLKMLGMVWRYTPGYLIWMIVEGILWGINNSIGIIYTKELLDALGNGRPFGSVLAVIVIYAVYMLVFFLFSRWYWVIYNPCAQERLRIALHGELFKKAQKLDIAQYDNPEFYNDFVITMDQSSEHVVATIEDTGKLINRIIASATITGVLFSVDLAVAAVILILSALRILVIFKTNRTNLKYSEEVNPIARKEGYINRIFRFSDYSKELRVTRVTDNLMNEYEDTVEKLKEKDRKFGKKYFALIFASYIIGALGTGLPLIIVLYKVLISKTVGIGGFAVTVNAIWSMSWLFSDLIERIMRYHEHGIFIDKIFRFMDCEPKIKSGELIPDPFESLKLKNVSFAYNEDKTTPPILDGIDMEIKKGEKIAIVGYNGAGKTTLIKLFLRLYDPDNGEILYNGVNMKEYSVDDLRDRTAVVFQDFKLFVATIAENVVGGEYDPSMEEGVMKALEKSMFTSRLKTLPNGINTIISKEFDNEGMIFSGGEQQKIAIARAFYQDADLIIMDEPSSALDPDAEYQLNKSIAEYADNKTVIFISHRLSTTRNADRIYMFDNGRIVECGTHDELIRANGKYAYMFNLQAEKYKSDASDK